MTTQSPSAVNRRSGISRRGFIFGVLLIAGALISVANVTWFSTSLESVLGQELVVSVTGQMAVPALSAAGILAVAAAIFLALSGTITRYLAVALIAGAGVLSVVSSVTAISDRESSVISQVAEETGTDALSGAVTVHAVAYGGVLLGALLIIAGLAGIFIVKSWSSATKKYDRRDSAVLGGAAPVSHTDPADAVAESGSRASSKNAPLTGGPAPSTPAPGNGRPQGEIESDERDMWDQLSQGIDPS